MNHSGNKLPLVSVSCLLLLSGLATHAYAVNPPSPGAVREPFSTPALQAPTVEAESPVQTESKPEAKPASTKRIQINRFEVSGNAAFSSKELLSQISELQGQKLTLEEVYAAAEVLTDYYRARGFSLARVVVPAQRISLGVIRLEVIEGLLNAVHFEGNQSYSAEFINDYLGSMQAGQGVSLESLERELLLLNDQPGLSSKAVVRPGPVYGTSDLVIQSEEKPYEGKVSLNNYGRVEVGEWRVEAELLVNNLSGAGDQLSFSGTRSEAGLLTYANIGYNRPINSQGTRLGGVISYIDYDVAGQFADLNIQGETTNFKLTLSHPWQRSRQQNILLGLSLGSNASESSTFGVTTSQADITLLEGSVLFNTIHANNAVSTLSAVLSTNLRSNKDGLEENAQKAKLVVDGSHTLNIDQNWSAFFRGVVAVSADPLVDSEKFSIGGQGSVRGFPSAEVRGDQGLLFTAELRRRFNLEGTLPGSARVFFDTGRVTRKLSAGLEQEENLSSLGLGFTIVPAKNFSVDMEYAKPIDAHETTDERSGGRVWVNMTARF